MTQTGGRCGKMTSYNTRNSNNNENATPPLPLSQIGMLSSRNDQTSTRSISYRVNVLDYQSEILSSVESIVDEVLYISECLQAIGDQRTLHIAD